MSERNGCKKQNHLVNLLLEGLGSSILFLSMETNTVVLPRHQLCVNKKIYNRGVGENPQHRNKETINITELKSKSNEQSSNFRSNTVYLCKVITS